MKAHADQSAAQGSSVFSLHLNKTPAQKNKLAIYSFPDAQELFLLLLTKKGLE